MSKRGLLLFGLSAATIFLSGCETTAYRVCPPLKEYGKQFANRLAAEIELLPPNSAIEEAIADYLVLRGQVKACR